MAVSAEAAAGGVSRAGPFRFHNYGGAGGLGGGGGAAFGCVGICETIPGKGGAFGGGADELHGGGGGALGGAIFSTGTTVVRNSTFLTTL
jgi:hypothetical protein